MLSTKLLTKKSKLPAIDAIVGRVKNAEMNTTYPKRERPYSQSSARIGKRSEYLKT